MFRVYYSKRPQFFQPPQRKVSELKETHACLYNINLPTKDEVYSYMQAHNWNPTADDIEYLKASNVHHASMSVDDIVLDMETGEYWQVIEEGWRKLDE